MKRSLTWCCWLALGAAQFAVAAVDRIEVKSRAPFHDFKAGPYIRISGTFVGSLDPSEPIPHLAQAARRADGRIEYSSEFEILAPERPSAGNRVMLFDVENRGHPITNGLYNTPVDPARSKPDAGNGYLEDNGYTVVSIHWEDGHGIRLPTYPGAGGKPAPLLAVGFAAIRDFAAFLRFETADKAGTPNPLAGTIRWAIASGSSQTARVLKSFLYAGFNRAGNRTVFDGLHPHIGQSGTMPYIPPEGAGAETVALTITGDSSVYPFTYAEILAPLKARGETPPKIVATNVEGDYYRRRLSLVRTGSSGITDVAIPETVRLWDFTGASHGIISGANAAICDMPRANLDWHPLTRAALAALTRWVVANEPPPPTKLISLTTSPAVPYLLPPPTADYPKAQLLVPRRDRDGIAEAGIRLPAVTVPLQTFGGWNAPIENNCGDMSVFAYPFARTRFERMMKNDPRPSLEERYEGPADYVVRFEAAAAALRKEGYLLEADAAALVEGARKTSTIVPERTQVK